MTTLADLFILFQTYTKVAKRGYAYLRFYDDLSGSLFCYDDIEMMSFDTVPEGCKLMAGLIEKAQGPV